MLLKVITVKNVQFFTIGVFENLIKIKKIKIKNILVGQKNCKGLIIYVTRHVYSRSIKMLSLYYHELMGNIKEHEGKKIFDG